MNNFVQKKPDYLFIASLVAIVFVAVYLAMDRLKDSHISEYLQSKGKELIAQIDNQQDRETLEAEYKKFIEKVDQRDVDPQKVEKFISAIYNLDQSRQELNEEQLAEIFENNLKKVFAADSAKVVHNQANEQWKKLQQRLQNIHFFEEKLKEMEIAAPKEEKSFTFSYTINDSLNIIVNEAFKDNLAKEAGFAKELKKLEKERAIIWENDAAQQKRESLEKTLKALEKANIAVSVYSETDSARTLTPAPSVHITPPSPVQSATPITK